jgi:molybdate-binding protein
MSRYETISAEIAREVIEHARQPGSDLPSVRELAVERRTTTSTVNRAYRELAAAGVIELAARRRGRVAEDGRSAARQFLAKGQTFRLAGSDDPALDLVIRHAGRSVELVGARGSFHGLTALSQGRADGAVIHLLHRSGHYNEPFAEAILRGREPTLVRLWSREQGLLLPRTNPRDITSAADLVGLRVAKREFGAGTRVLLDRLLIDAGLSPDEVSGPTADSHLEVGLAVASGIADAGVGVRATATALDLEFVSLRWEHYDLVLPGDRLGPASPLIEAVSDRTVQKSIEALGGYRLEGAGTIKRLSDSGGTVGTAPANS